MPIKKLTDVPEHIWTAPAQTGESEHWQSDYNIATWIRCEKQTRGSIRLFLLWRDNHGEHNMCVDRSDISSKSLLLSGIASIKGQGPLKSLSIGIETLNGDFVVDELFVQPARSAGKNQKIIG